MAGVTLPNSANVFQIHYGKKVNKTTNDRTIFYNKTPKHPEAEGGRYREEYIVTGYPATGGGVGVNGTVPTAGSIPDLKTDIYQCHLVYPAGVDWAAYYKSKNAASFINVLTQKMNRLADFVAVDMERMMVGDGTAKLGHINAKSAATTTGWTIDVPNWQLPGLHVGSRFVVLAGTANEITETSAFRNAPATSANPGYFIITNNIPDAGAATGDGQITIGGAVGTDDIAVGDVIVKHMGVIENGVSAGVHSGTEFIGYRGHIDNSYPPLRTDYEGTFPTSGTHQGIDPTTNGSWIAGIVDAGGAEVDSTWFDKAGEVLTARGSMGPESIQFYAANQVQETIVKRNAEAGIRYPVTSTNPSLPMGAKSSMNERVYMQFAARDIIISRFITPTDLYGIGPGMYRFECKPYGFHRPGFGEGPVWHRDFDRRMQDQAEAYCITQIGILNRNNFFRIKNLASS